MSLIEVIIALSIFSLSVFIISQQVNVDLLGIANSQKKIAEMYDAGI